MLVPKRLRNTALLTPLNHKAHPQNRKLGHQFAIEEAGAAHRRLAPNHQNQKGPGFGRAAISRSANTMSKAYCTTVRKRFPRFWRFEPISEWAMANMLHSSASTDRRNC